MFDLFTRVSYITQGFIPNSGGAAVCEKVYGVLINRTQELSHSIWATNSEESCRHLMFRVVLETNDRVKNVSVGEILEIPDIPNFQVSYVGSLSMEQALTHDLEKIRECAKSYLETGKTESKKARKRIGEV